MSRVLMACLLALLGVFAVAGTAVAGTATATPGDVSQELVVAQQDDTTAPDLNPEQQVSPEERAETKKKLWIGGIALLMFVLVYYRNKKRWQRWRKRVAAKKAAEG